jgi:hypothetical protein
MKHSKLVLGLVVLLSAAVLVGCGEKKEASAAVATENSEQKAASAAVAEKPKFGIAAMTDEDKVYFAHSFTTLGTVPYGKIMPESLFKNLLRGQKLQEGQRFVSFEAPKKGMKQNAHYPEWLRVKGLVVEVPTRRIVGARGRAGPFAGEAAVQSYLDSEIRPDLNGQICMVEVQKQEEGEMFRALCESKFGSKYSLGITLTEVAPGEFWIDALTTLK